MHRFLLSIPKSGTLCRVLRFKIDSKLINRVKIGQRIKEAFKCEDNSLVDIQRTESRECQLDEESRIARALTMGDSFDVDSYINAPITIRVLL